MVNAIFVTNYLQGGIDQKELKVIIFPICVYSVLSVFLYTRTCIYCTPMAFLLLKKLEFIIQNTESFVDPISLLRIVWLEKFSFRNMRP